MRHRHMARMLHNTGCNDATLIYILFSELWAENGEIKHTRGSIILFIKLQTEQI